ncbi:8-oxo-dGTP diphosphatase [Propionicimonas paludicola]|uniref:8-oxo-dGTP diphosphatase n=1 Tax=Propionicimonas paludicola TaxID=185243 RepID=A0A2A9CST4_9ACTN|nr:8-oxo-dGTP diphosphatase [Propionicimonas paludicola]PFG17503.1 8-oxo-dGTP diphosphatase [Propionicimonas paludicola]
MYTPIVGTLGYLLSDDGQRVLLVHRSRDGDVHAGKWNGLGGKLEPDEDVYTCLCRELREEAGIEVTSARLRGTVSWPGFGPDGEDWLGFIFVVDSFTGELPERNEDGPLAWHRIDELDALPMWPGDRYWLSMVFDDGPAFHGVMPYAGGEPVSWSCARP